MVGALWRARGAAAAEDDGVTEGFEPGGNGGPTSPLPNTEIFMERVFAGVGGSTRERGEDTQPVRVVADTRTRPPVPFG